jgi:D-alanyl-D-alanine carboxypeptidase/D-alanyl-D-alanine-endopeptidase (penicillin-binding protein 4)
MTAVSSHPVRARLVVAIAVVLSLACGGVAILPSLSQPEAAAAGVEVTTPVFSLRRVAGPIVRQVAGRRLHADVDAILAQPLFEDVRDDWCTAVHDADGYPILTHDLSRDLIPASNMKLLTAAVLLEKIGPDARYVTPVKAAAPPQAGAVGDLWLVGSGDPLLATAGFAATAGWMDTPKRATSIEALADRVFNAGVRRIGRVLGDESRYDRQRYVPSWSPSYASVPYVGPQSALTVNSGFVQYEPRQVPASAPATHAANVLADLLRARGVTVGSVGEGTVPEQGVTVAQIESPPMAEVVADLLQHSDNLAAELMVKELGVRFGGAGTTAAGLSVVHATATAMGLPVGRLATADGSGLDRGDRMSCALVDGILRRSGEGSALGKGLSVAGSVGTLLRRFTTTPAAGKVRAKTGSLEGVASLSGWATARDGRSLQFTLLTNDIPYEAAGNAFQNQFVSALAAYPKAPPPDEISPGPPRPRSSA